MESSIVTLNDLILEYYTCGSGPESIICLHGHGRPVSDFHFLGKSKRKLILIVLPHHGQSFFPSNRIEKNPLSILEFNHLFEKILKAEAINKFHFIAFSQGGRFVLSLMPIQEQKIQSVHLISPDAMDNNSFYNWSSRIGWARNLFKSWEEDPQRFIKAARIAKRLGLVRPKVYSFIQKFASNKESFQRASITWRGFRNIRPNNDELKKVIARSDWRFVVIMGKYDQVIRTRQAELFLKRINQLDALIEIECGHDFFKEENIALLSPHIKI